MKQIVILLIGLAVVLITTGAVFPQTQDELDWGWALFHNQAADYAGYIESWPQGNHLDLAQVFYDQKSWDEALRSNSIEAMELYLQNQSQGRFVATAERYREQLQWRVARETNTIKSYQQYLGLYPDGRFAGAAQERQQQLRQDDRPFLAARQQGSRTAYENFLAQYPGHQREAEVRAELQRISTKDLAQFFTGLVYYHNLPQ